MPDPVAVSAPTSTPSPQKIEKSGGDKPAADGAAKTDERDFAEVLDEAAQAPPAEAAILDPAAAMAAGPLPVTAAENAGGGELGVGGMPGVEGRLPAAVQPLRPEARAALQATLPEATAAAAQDAARTEQDAALAGQDDLSRQADARSTPGKPFELTAEKPVLAAQAEAAPATEAVEAPEAPNPTPTTVDAAAEANRRERPATLRLDTHLPVHSPRFAEGFNQQVVVLAQHGIQQAQMSLAPPELGPVDVRITIAHDEATVQIAAPSGVAREAIQEALPKLKEMMEQSGVRLNDASVFAQLPQREQQAGAQARAEWWQQPSQTGGRPEAEDLPVPVIVQHRGLVDAYA